MNRKFAVMVLAFALFFVSVPLGVYAEPGESTVQKELLTVTVDENYTGNTNSVKLVWKWTEVVPKGIPDNAEDVVFSIYNGNDPEALVSDLGSDKGDSEDPKVDEEEIKGYTYSPEEKEYSFVVEGLEAETEYEFEVRIEEEDETIAFGRTEKYTIERAEKPADVIDAVEPAEEAAEPAETAEPAKNMKKTGDDQLRGEAIITLEKGEVKGSVFELKWTLSGYEGNSPKFTIQNDGVTIEGADPEGSVDEGFSYTVTGLKPGTEYTFKVILGEDEASAEITGATKHVKVANFKAVAKGNKKNKNYLALTWSAVTNATKYVVTWSGDNYAAPIYEGSALKYNMVIKEAGKKYSFKILAYNEAGDIISWEDGTVCSGTIPKITIKKSSGTDTTLKLSVGIPAGNKGSYRVVVTDANKKSKKLPVIRNTGKKQNASVVAKKLTAARTYKCYVYNSAGVVSKTITVKTALADVKGFQALSSAGAVILKWKKVPRATSYVITRTGGGSAKKTWTIKDGKLSVTDDTVAQDKNYKYTIRAKKESFPTSRKAAKVNGDAVRTMHYTIQFGTTRTLTSHTGGSVPATFSAGTIVTATGYTNGKYIFWYNGREYQVMRASISSASVKQIDTSRTYSTAEATSFVHRMGLSSRTKYLIWVNVYTQHEYVFQGEKGNWKLLWDDEIATGRPTTPTPIGLTHIESKDPEEHGLKYWSCCYSFSIHSIPYGAPVNYPTSGACVRNYDHRAKWVYDNCKIGTAVYIF